MATTHNTFTLTTAGTAYQIVAAIGANDNTVASLGGNGMDITIQNNNVVGDLLIGGSTVTTASFGFKLVPGAAISFELDGKDAIWAVSSTAGVTANFMSVNLEGVRLV
jgi:hypothetical protein